MEKSSTNTALPKSPKGEFYFLYVIFHTTLLSDSVRVRESYFSKKLNRFIFSCVREWSIPASPCQKELLKLSWKRSPLPSVVALLFPGTILHMKFYGAVPCRWNRQIGDSFICYQFCNYPSSGQRKPCSERQIQASGKFEQKVEVLVCW